MTSLAMRKKLISWLEVAEDKKLKAIYALLEDEIEPGGRIDIMQYNKELEEAEAEFAKGDFITHAAMKKAVSKW